MNVPNGVDVAAVKAALVDTVERQIVPAITKVLQDNRGGARTSWRDALGIAS